MRAGRIVWGCAGVIFVAALVLAWHFAAEFRLISPIYFPSPERTYDALQAGFHRDLAPRIAVTLEHLFYGWMLASIGGILIGAAVGLSPALRAFLTPTLEFFRPLPASALFPVAIAIVGLTPSMVLAVIGFGALFRGQHLIELRGGFALNRRHLAHHIAARCRQLLNVPILVCFHSGRERLTVVFQLRAQWLRRIARLPEDRLGLGSLSVGQIQLAVNTSQMPLHKGPVRGMLTGVGSRLRARRRSRGVCLRSRRLRECYAGCQRPGYEKFNE